ncbi:hypothetical protein BVX99_02225, partial [bacterium F16]
MFSQQRTPILIGIILAIVFALSGYYLYQYLYHNSEIPPAPGVQVVATPDIASEAGSARKSGLPTETKRDSLAEPRIVEADISFQPNEISPDNLYVDREKHIWDVKNAGQPQNIPQVELRFVKLSPFGSFEPAKIQEVNLLPTMDGKAQHKMAYEFGGLECKSTGNKNFEDFYGGYVVRMPWAPGSKRTYRGKQRGRYIFGGVTYYVSVIPFDEPDIDYRNRPSTYIRMPEHLPDGHRYVVEMDIGKGTDSPYTTKYHDLIVRAAKNFAGKKVHYRSSNSSVGSYKSFGEDGICKFTTQYIKGSLKVYEKLSSGQFITMYEVDDISEAEIVLPKDASWSLEQHNVIKFKLKLECPSTPQLQSNSVLFSRDE